MSSEVRDTPNSVTLHLDVRREHLTDEGFETAKPDNEDLVLRCQRKIHPSYPSASSTTCNTNPATLTIHRQIPQRSTRRPLHLRVMTPQQEQHRVQRVPSHLSHFLFGDLCESERGGSLEVDVVGEGEGGEGGEGGAGEEVGGLAVCEGGKGERERGG